MKAKLVKKMTAILLALMMVINFSAVDFRVSAATPETLAAWDYTAAPGIAAVPATSGVLAAGSELTNFKNISPSYSSTSLSINGWNGGADISYWQLGLSTKGYDNIALSARTRSSGTGPRDFKVIYSTDGGTTWNEVPNSAYAITGTGLSNYMPTLTLPVDASDTDRLLIRFVMTSNISSRAGTGTYPVDEAVQAGGTSNINNITVLGTPVTNDTTVSGISATPLSGTEVALNSSIALTCSTEGAIIMYSLNDSAYIPYDPNLQIVLTSLPATLKAYGTKEGMNNSVISTFVYSQARASAVNATPNGGAIELNQPIALGSETPNSLIKYSLDNGATWLDYNEPITLSILPAAIMTYATAPGLIDGAMSTYYYTQKVNGEYNIYFGQLHSHSSYSDGSGTVNDAFNYAKNTAKVDFLAVTDHSNSLDNANTSNILNGSGSAEWAGGHATADNYTDGNFVGIYAYEMTWSNGTGHINTFNTPGFETRETAKYKNADGLKQYYDVLKQVPDSISQFNHPGQTFGDFNDFAYYDPQIDNLISLLEVGNGEGAVRSSNYFPSYEFYTRALDKGWHVSPTNNQDNHLGLWGNANTARTVILTDSLTRNSIYDAMRNMRTYATEDNNLRIKYTLNGEVMGTILKQKPDSVNIKVELEDPDNEILGNVSIISNGGKIVASQVIPTNKDTLEFSLAPDYSYYYVRVDQIDKDIAVTAPVWVGEVEKAGISKTTASTTLPIKGESLKITTSMFNNENAPMNISSLIYSINGTVINTAPALDVLNPLSTASYSFDFIPDNAGKFNIDIRMAATINGVGKVFTDVLKLDVTDPALVTRVVADGSHFNDYVNGYYANNLGNFTAIANSKQIAVNIEKTKLTDEGLQNIRLLIISAPAKKTGSSNGVSYQPQSFTDEDIAVVKRFVDNGGNLIVCGIADYQDGTGVYQTSTQMNRLLEGIGASTRFNNDEVIDNEQKVNNQNFRLAFDDYNMASPYLNGVMPGQTYSFYSGCSIAIDEADLASGKTTWLVKGHDTTESIDSNRNLPGVALPKGSVYALAVEQLSGGGKMFIGGTVYISDFEVKAQLDNSTQLQNSNYNITMNILDSIKNDLTVKPISQARSAARGEVFCVEGTVTAGKVPADNAFFDTIYIQDTTGGINIFPVSAIDISVGQKVKVIGTVDEYLGDTELRVIEYSVTDTAINPLTPTLMATADSMLDANGGMLIQVEGIVESMDSQNIFINDGSGTARVFLDGYIGDGSNDPAKAGKWDPLIMAGDRVKAIGLASVDTQGPRLRVRNTAEVVRIKDTIPPVITITGVVDGGIYNTDVTPIITVNEGTNTSLLNNEIYSGETITREGYYKLEVNAVDRDMNKSTVILKFMIDKTAPLIVSSIKNGDSFDRLSRLVIINAAIDKGSGIKTLETRLDNNVIHNISTVNLEELSFGNHNMTIKAVDKAGNAAVKEISFKVTADKETLKHLVEKFNMEGKFKTKGIYQSLTAKLKGNNLKPFISYVEAQRGKGMSIETANTLLEYAKWIDANK